MPLDPLRTDEKRDDPAAYPRKDFEGQMMSGCMTIGLGSVISYVLVAWPLFFVPEYSIQGLLQWAGLGVVPLLIFGAVLCRRFGLAGAAGFVGGAIPGAVFLYLRLNQTLARGLIPDLPKAEYPESWVGFLPLLFILLCLLWAGFLVPGREFRTEAEQDSDRES
ncbi:MAG: hypothetical protein MH204_10405 [Fimbriimonadaceae bacterium]|nr:hypothetical protein [Fimbriimonadaceae bacterium]